MTAATLEAAVERATMRAGERFVQDAIEAAAAASRVLPMTPEQRDFFIDGYTFSAAANETNSTAAKGGLKLRACLSTARDLAIRG